MKKLTLLLATIGLYSFLPVRAQSYLGEYQIQAQCTLAEDDDYEESHSYVIDIKPCNEQGFDFQFHLDKHSIYNDVKGKIKVDDQFVLPAQQFAREFDTTYITYFGGNGSFKGDSIFMQYHMANPHVYGALACDCKGVRLDATPLKIKPYLGPYLLKGYCMNDGITAFDHTQDTTCIINIEPCDEYGFDFQFQLNLYDISDYVKGRILDADRFMSPDQHFFPDASDSTYVFHIRSYGNFIGNDSLVMHYEILSTRHGSEGCYYSGVRLKTAVETPLENPSTFWRLSPQPATESVQAVCEAAETGWHSGNWRLVNAGGKALRRGTFSDGRFDVSLSAIPAGLYFIEITANGTTCRLKCVKK